MFRLFNVVFGMFSRFVGEVEHVSISERIWQSLSFEGVYSPECEDLKPGYPGAYDSYESATRLMSDGLVVFYFRDRRKGVLCEKLEVTFVHESVPYVCEYEDNWFVALRRGRSRFATTHDDGVFFSDILAEVRRATGFAQQKVIEVSAVNGCDKEV